MDKQLIDTKAEIAKEWRKAVWTIVVAALLTMGGVLGQSFVMQQSMNDQLKILQEEQKLIRTKIDLMQVQIERKVDRGTLDDCLETVNVKLDKISDNIFSIQQAHFKN